MTIIPTTSTPTPTVPPVVPPVGTPPAAPVDPVVAAINKLSKSNIDNLWEDNVTNAAWYAKISGFICYLWGRSDALEKDKDQGESIAEFNQATVELVNAVAHRALTPQESNALNFNAVLPDDYVKQAKAATSQICANEALEKFYAAFKTRISKLQVNEDSADFGIYSNAAQRILTLRAENERANFDMGSLLPTKMKTTVQEFTGKILNDMVEAYATQPLASITGDSFKAKVALVYSYFSNLRPTETETKVEIEAKLRQAISKKHKADEFTAIRGEYANQSQYAPHFVAAKGTVKAKLEAERTKLQAELTTLCGVNNARNGKLNTVWGERTTAETALTTAKAAYVVARSTFPGGVTTATATEDLLGMDIDPQLVPLKADLKAKFDAFNAKDKEYNELDTRRQFIAQFTGDQITGGRLHDIGLNLDPAALALSARAETNKVVNFYDELNQAVDPVDNASKVARSQALHQIIDTPQQP